MLSCNVQYTFHCLEFLDERLEVSVIANGYGKRATEHAVVTVDADAAKGSGGLFYYDRGDVVHDADVVATHDVQGALVLTSAFTCPLGTDDAIAKA